MTAEELKAEIVSFQREESTISVIENNKIKISYTFPAGTSSSDLYKVVTPKKFRGDLSKLFALRRHLFGF